MPIDTSPLVRALDALEREPRLTVALQLAEELRYVAAATSDRDGAAAAAARLVGAVRDGDDLTSLAAIHALGSVAHPVADDVLVGLVVDGDEPFAGHAAWALGARRSSAVAIAALEGLASGDGFSAMLAERTLIEWQRSGEPADPTAEHPALGWRGGDGGPGDADGIVVVQPFLHARIDRDGTSLGSGDAGGIASLLRSLGTSLARLDGIDEVITVTRRHEGETATEVLGPGHRVVRLELGGTGRLPWREAWGHRVSIERQLIRLGRSLGGRRVVWHLRMADVGTLAAAAAARRLGQPIVFTAAPDPHIVIDALQDDGRLDRRRFAVEDAALQYWFRARMVERLTAQADHLAVLPRPTIVRELVELVGLDPADVDRRVTVIAEGVDVAQIDRASDRRRAVGTAPVVRRLLDGLPMHRRGLPWVLTVGRLHPTKGAQRVVQAVADEPGLAERVNVVVVGGDLARPSADEQSTIESIRRAAAGCDPALVTLTGSLPPNEVADLLAEVAHHGGVYTCAADKEEFGLAIVEAMAAGVVVVAPQRGGPRSYVDDGDTGVLCDSLSAASVRSSIVRALDLAAAPDRAARAARARTMVRRDLGIDTMAAALAGVYGALVPDLATARPHRRPS